MIRTGLALMLAMTLAVPAVAQMAPREGKVRHSGRILEVATDGSAIVLEEMVAWTGPGTGIVNRSIRLTPRTSIRLVERTDAVDVDRTALPGWDTTPIDVVDLRPGDFVTVTTDDDQRGVALALTIVRPAAD